MARTALSLRKRIAAVALLCLIGVVVAVGLLEITTRLFFPTSDFFYEWDSAIGMKLVPLKKGRSVRRGVFDVQVEVNSAGFRDREHAIAKPPGTRRVVLLGDSFIEAMQVRFEESLTPLLEQRLQSSGPTELISLSVSGTGTAREYLALREYGLRYQPDLVLLFFVGNDVSDNSRELKQLSYLPYPQTTPAGELVRDAAGRPLFTPFHDQSSYLSAISSAVRDHSKAYRLVREAVDSSPGINGLLYKLRLISTPPEAVNAPIGDNFGFYEIYRVEQKPVWQQAWNVTEQLMLAVRDLATENGASFGVVLIPAVWDVDDAAWEGILNQLPLMRETPLDRERPSRLLSEFLTANGVPVVNLLPAFRDRAPTLPAPPYLRGDAHWAPEGHRLAAELLKEPVSEMLNR